MTIDISLTEDEATVLLEYLHREVDDANGRRLIGSIEHDGELWALNHLCCMLEQVCTAPFLDCYPAILEQARSALAAQSGPWPDDEAK